MAEMFATAAEEAAWTGTDIRKNNYGSEVFLAMVDALGMGQEEFQRRLGVSNQMMDHAILEVGTKVLIIVRNRGRV